MGQPMGIGTLGFNNMIFKRKFRFTFEIQGACNNSINIPQDFVKVAARPTFNVEETELNFLNGKIWVPGKASWETISVTYIDVAYATAAPLYNWLASIYDFTDPVKLHMATKPSDFAGTGILKMYDGCGTVLETWTLQYMFPTAVNFGELDYSSSEICEIQLTLRYSNVIYKPNCPGMSIKPCCSGC